MLIVILTSVVAGKPQPSAHELQHQSLPSEEYAMQHAQPKQLDVPLSKSGSPGSTEQTAEIKLHSEERSEHRCCSKPPEVLLMTRVTLHISVTHHASLANVSSAMHKLTHC